MDNTFDPKEFTSMDDSPTNNGWTERDWEEIRPRSLRWNDDEVDEDEEDIDGAYGEGEL